MEKVLIPAVAAIRDTGIPYKGVIYAGLMIEPDGAMKVLEFNARFGDPEAQVLMPRLASDLSSSLCRSSGSNPNRFLANSTMSGFVRGEC